MVEHGSHRLKDLAGQSTGCCTRISRRSFHRSAPSTHPNNLPPQLTSFIGREQEIREVRELLRSKARLVTLSGPGGTGKTRIALQAAAERVEQYPGGVWWVDLALFGIPGW